MILLVKFLWLGMGDVLGMLLARVGGLTDLWEGGSGCGFGGVPLAAGLAGGRVSAFPCLPPLAPPPSPRTCSFGCRHSVVRDSCALVIVSLLCFATSRFAHTEHFAVLCLVCWLLCSLFCLPESRIVSMPSPGVPLIWAAAPVPAPGCAALDVELVLLVIRGVSTQVLSAGTSHACIGSPVSHLGLASG